MRKRLVILGIVFGASLLALVAAAARSTIVHWVSSAAPVDIVDAGAEPPVPGVVDQTRMSPEKRAAATWSGLENLSAARSAGGSGGVAGGSGTRSEIPPPSPPASVDASLFGRSYQNVLTLAEGVNDADGGGLNVNGVKPKEFKGTVDGTDSFVPDGEMNTETYARTDESPYLAVAQSPLSTFSIDVDTASYANVRRFLEGGSLPPADAVRIEEMLNYFPYDLEGPAGTDPFAIHVDLDRAPWAPEHALARIAIKAREMTPRERPEANLVFLIDVSGSMADANKLPLVKNSLRLLVGALEPRDRVAMVVYAGSSGLVLPSTPATRSAEIVAAIDRLDSGGSTNGGEGIRLAYHTAREAFRKSGVNRVILCTDGDFNVGVTSPGELTRIIEEEAKSGVFLTVLGFGMGNLKDATLESLADRGNGNYAYIDSLLEARKALVEESGGTLVTIAKDVKIQVEFNPAMVAGYRLLGYENRRLADRDFEDDTKDAGEIGAGHAVTALYEIIRAGGEAPGSLAPIEMKYQRPPTLTDKAETGELFTVKVRYKEPDGETSRLVSVPVPASTGVAAARRADFDFATSVAAFGLVLRRSTFRGTAGLGAVRELATRGLSRDPGGYRARFLDLVARAEALSPPEQEVKRVSAGH